MSINTTTVGGHYIKSFLRRPLGHGPPVVTGNLAADGSRIETNGHRASVPQTPDRRPDQLVGGPTIRAIIHEVFPLGNRAPTQGSSRILPPPGMSPVRGIDRINEDCMH